MSTAVVYVTAPDKAEALRIGRNLVEDRLAACANILEGATSLYWWEGSVHEDHETILIVKTRESLVDAVIARVKSLHRYDCPCVISWPIESGNAAYLDWIKQETRE